MANADKAVSEGAIATCTPVESTSNEPEGIDIDLRMMYPMYQQTDDD